ncbi:hypothetical protein [Actinoplanes sp. DH11]|uniref:hypothetical protein n=1 Tax=Actinoplanes sp. DH11 TaxID=2857011 RepID=UPI001E30F18B|nr:hypothetical protein [Actinoplanes sp. DH11]
MRWWKVLRAGEDLLDAAARELAEETRLRGITPRTCGRSPPTRRPRWAPVGPGPGGLAFDHDPVLRGHLRLVDGGPAAGLRGSRRWRAPGSPRRNQINVEPTGDLRSLPTGRPAALFRRGPAEALYPPLQRPRRS